MNNSIHFIVNPNSGNKKGLQLQQYLQSLLKDNYVVKLSSFAGEAILLTQQSITENASVIVSCGGDGTLREVASQLVFSDIPLGIIPIGSGNGVARNLRIPFQYEKALELIDKKYSTTIDVGQVNEHYFFSNLGLGIDSQVIDYFSKQKVRGLKGYVKSSIITVFKYKPIRLHISAKNLDFEGKVFLLNIANANQIGYNFTFSPHALLHDGLLNLLLIKNFSLLGWIEYAWFFIFKKLKRHSQAFDLDVEEISITVLSDFCKTFQIDGDAVALISEKLDIKVLKKALKIITNKP